MSFDEHWAAQAGAVKTLGLPANCKVMVSLETIRRIARQAYEAGHQDGRAAQSIFEKIFGKTK